MSKRRKSREPFTLEPRAPASHTGNVLQGNTLWRGDGSWEPRSAVEEREDKAGEFPFIISGSGSDSIAKRNQELKNWFVIEFTRARKNATSEEANAAWIAISEAQTKLDQLLEAQKTKVVRFENIEECLRIVYLNQPVPPSEEPLEKTIERYRQDWKREQINVETRRRQLSFNPDEDFRKRVLDPKTRDAAIKEYLIDRVDKQHYLIQAVKILFELTGRR